MANGGFTLTEAAYWTRRFLTGFVAFIVLFIGYKVVANYRADHARRQPTPAPVERPTVAFDRLPELNFSEASPSRPVEYELRTANGQLPTFPSIAKIYLMPRPQGVTFFSLEEGKEFAGKLGFTTEPEQIEVGRYRWNEAVPLPGDEESTTSRVLVMDVASGNFKLSYNYSRDPTLLDQSPPAQARAIEQAEDFLKGLGLYPQDLAGGEHRVTYLAAEGNDLTPTLSQTDADFARLDFFRQGVADALRGPSVSTGEITPVTPPMFDQALVQILMSSAQERSRKYVRVDYVFWPVDYENFATYPLRSAQQAFDDLQNGAGAVISGGSQTRVTVRRVSLAYYNPRQHQDFFQPVFIFEGDNNFVAYVPAVESVWIESGTVEDSQ